MPDTAWTKCWRCLAELTPQRMLLMVEVTPRWVVVDPPAYEIPLCQACAELLKQAEFIAA